jgi:hypothetical protein
MIHIAVMNQSTVVTDDGVKSLLPPLQTQWNRDLAPVWNLEQMGMTFIAKGGAPDPADWWMVFLDDSNQAGALAVHDLTNTGMPIAKVFCRTILGYSESIAVAASHELCEMGVDPEINLGAQAPNGRWWAMEVCDPCEDDRYAYDINGVLVSDFVTPNWFKPRAEVGKLFSFKGNVVREFDVLPGGYAQWFSSLHGWQQVLGHDASGSAVTAEVGSRRERRCRQFDGILRLSRCEFEALAPAQPLETVGIEAGTV